MAAEVLRSDVKSPASEVEVVEPSKLSENGHHSGDHKDEGEETVSESMSADATGETAEDELWRKRLWFLRVPKPPEVGAIKVLEQELETYKAQYKLLTESFNVKKVERDAARDNTRTARDAFLTCKKAFEDKLAIVQPMRDAAKSTRGAANNMRESFSELEVRSEPELDERLQEMHHRISHESITLNEEKRLMQHIKKLESQRAKVREYEATIGKLADSRSEVKRIEGELSEHKAELDALYNEKKVQSEILDKFKEQERELDKEVEEILAERKRIKNIQDEAYSRVSELKSMQRAKNDEYYNNRRFSRHIREVLAAGKLDEARELCSQQMEEAHVKLNLDPDYRSEYFALWEQQRKSPVSMAAVDDEDADLAPSKGRREQRHEPAAEPSKKAEQVIAAVLEEARGEIMRVKAAAASAAAAAAPSPAVAVHTLVAASQEPLPKPAPKPFKAAKEAPKHVVEIPVIPDTRFELPEAIKSKKALTSEELKALEREHQRQVELDAERRKQRKQQEREKKRQRALQEQTAKAKQSSAPATPLESDAAPEQSGEESGREGPATAVASEQGPAVAAAVQPTAAGKAVVAKVSKVASITSKPKPQARRPAHTKKPLTKQLRSFWKEYQVHVTVMAVVGMVLALFLMYITTPGRGRA